MTDRIKRINAGKELLTAEQMREDFLGVRWVGWENKQVKDKEK